MGLKNMIKVKLWDKRIGQLGDFVDAWIDPVYIVSATKGIGTYDITLMNGKSGYMMEDDFKELSGIYE
jgi:hypothetical protein